MTTLLSKDSSVKEPSGIVFHSTRGTLFVAGDRGDLVEVSLAGKVLNTRNIGDRNFEGLTVGPRGDLFALQEGEPPTLFTIDPETLHVLTKAKVRTKNDGDVILGARKNKSAEGITYVPDENAFYVVNQNPARLVRLDIDDGHPDAKISKSVSLKHVVKAQASDVAFDPVSGNFLVLESGKGSGPNFVYEVTRQGRLVRSMRVPGDRTEGLALGPNGIAYLAEDAGGVLRVTP